MDEPGHNAGRLVVPAPLPKGDLSATASPSRKSDRPRGCALSAHSETTGLGADRRAWTAKHVRTRTIRSRSEGASDVGPARGLLVVRGLETMDCTGPGAMAPSG